MDTLHAPADCALARHLHPDNRTIPLCELCIGSDSKQANDAHWQTRVAHARRDGWRRGVLAMADAVFNDAERDVDILATRLIGQGPP
jgi:hypothetical protein